MNITILGTGTCVPNLNRFPCSGLVRAGGLTILVDMGPGIMGQLLKTGTRIHDIDILLLTHFHVDHCADLAPFLFSTKYPGFGRDKKLHLFGGNGIHPFFDALNRAYANHLTMPEDFFEIHSLPETGETDLESDTGSIRLEWAAMNHNPESRGYRITDAAGFSAVFSGDTDVTDNLVGLSRDADILVCESAVPDAFRMQGHLTPSLAGGMAQKAGVKKLVLTHFYPECEDADLEAQCRKTYNGQIVLARDLLTL